MKAFHFSHIIKSIVLLALFISTGSKAACFAAGNPIVDMVQPPIVVQRDLPVGSVFARISLQVNNYVFSCDGIGENDYYLAMAQFSTPSSIPGYYETNIPGVGIKMGVFSNPPFHAHSSYTVAVNIYDTNYRTIELIKTGNITGGKLNSGVFAVMRASDNVTVAETYNIIGDYIMPVACSILTPNIQVPLDDISAATFTSVGTTAKPKEFNVGLDCDIGAKVNAKLTGVQNADSSADGVLQLSGAGGDEVASGVGIQILYNNAPLALNNNIVLKTSEGGQETFPFTAQYYQTKDNVKAGSANATATLELTYQ